MGIDTQGRQVRPGKGEKMTKGKSYIIGFVLIIVLLFVLAVVYPYIPQQPKKNKYEKAQEEKMEKHYKEYERVRNKLLDDYRKGGEE